LRNAHTEIQLLELEIATTQNVLQQKEASITSLSVDLEKQARLLQQELLMEASLQEDVLVEEAILQDIETVVQEAETGLEDKNLAYTALGAELTQVQTLLLQVQQTQLTKQENESALQTQLQGAVTANKHLALRRRTVEKQLHKQQEDLRHAEAQLQGLETKVNRGLGIRSVDETEELKVQVQALEEARRSKEAKAKQAVKDCDTIVRDVKAALRRQEELRKLRDQLRQQFTTLELETATAETALKQTTKAMEEAMVAHDVLKVDLKTLQDAARSKNVQVLAGTHDKEALRGVAAEKKAQLAREKDDLNKQLRMAEEERHKLVLRINEKQQGIEVLKSRYKTRFLHKRRGKGGNEGK
jgi:hypothetical protein